MHHRNKREEVNYDFTCIYCWRHNLLTHIDATKKAFCNNCGSCHEPTPGYNKTTSPIKMAEQETTRRSFCYNSPTSRTCGNDFFFYHLHYFVKTWGLLKVYSQLNNPWETVYQCLHQKMNHGIVSPYKERIVNHSDQKLKGSPTITSLSLKKKSRAVLLKITNARWFCGGESLRSRMISTRYQWKH